MHLSEKILEKIESQIESNENNDFHNIQFAMLSASQHGLLIVLREKQSKLDRYFNNNIDIYKDASQRSPKSLLKLCLNILKYYNQKDI